MRRTTAIGAKGDPMLNAPATRARIRHVSRRTVLAGAAALTACGTFGQGSDDGPQGSAARFAELEKRVDGRLGVSAIDADGQELFAHRADERFMMCSTFKAVLAAQALALADARAIALAETIHFQEADLLEYAPVAREHVDKGRLTIAELSEAAVVLSDNTAANLLLDRLGGPRALTRFFRDIGDDVSRLDRMEPELNVPAPGDLDTTTPAAMAETMATIVTGETVLSHTSRDRLSDWLVRSPTGRTRLRAGLPEGWVAGGKTGSGFAGEANDVVVAWPPSGAPVVIACYLEAPDVDGLARDAVHAEVGRFAAEALAQAA